MKIKIKSLTRPLAGFVGALVLFGAASAGAQQVVETIVYASFTSTNNAPAGSLVLGSDDGVLYGTANGALGSLDCTAFRVNRDGSGFQVLHRFGTDAPAATAPRLIPTSLLLGSDGLLYGTTSAGGANGAGTVFKMGRDGGGYTVLHDFSSTDGLPHRLMQAGDGRLYGVGLTIFTLDTSGNNYTVLHTNNAASDGSLPYSALLQADDGALYGMMRSGGTNSLGTIFKLNTNGSGFQVLHSFPDGVNDGKNPFGSLIQAGDGALYGTTSSGGTNSAGTIFKINTDGDDYIQLYSFGGGSDGSSPAAGLTPGIDGMLYGTTETGGATPAGRGTIFKIGLDGSGYKQLYNFPTNGYGKSPDASLVRGAASDGAVVYYGTTSLDQVSSFGTVFAVVVNPPLSITPAAYQSGNQVALYWPAWAQGAVLQATTNLASGPWVAVTNGAPLTGVQVSNAAPGLFYRLTWPQ